MPDEEDVDFVDWLVDQTDDEKKKAWVDNKWEEYCELFKNEVVTGTVQEDPKTKRRYLVQSGKGTDMLHRTLKDFVGRKVNIEIVAED